MPDITAIINAHSEGMIAVPSLRSIERAATQAQSNGLRVEIIAVLDRASQLTGQIFESWCSSRDETTLIRAEFGDLGLSRNLGVASARGKWVAFLDADDLWSANWLEDAYNAAEAESRRCVWHPECNLYFGLRPHVFSHVDMDDASFQLSALAVTNLWTALCFAERELLLDIPYRFSSREKQIGYEDWGWNLETVSCGVIHKVVPHTAHAIRTKAVSLVSQTSAASSLPHPSTAFRDAVERQGRSLRDSGVLSP